MNDQLERVGAPYRMREGRIQWIGEKRLAEAAIEPALAALADPRLATPANDFEHALRDPAHPARTRSPTA